MGVLTGLVLLMVFMLSLFSLLSFAHQKAAPADRIESWISAYSEPESEQSKTERTGVLSALGGQAERLGIGRRIMERTHIELIRADIPLTGYEFNIARLGIGLALGLVVALPTRNAAVGLLAVPGVWLLAGAYVQSKKSKRLRQFGNQLGDALMLFSNSLRAGFSFMQAVSSVAREMPDPISKEFTLLLKEMSLGLSVEKGLSNLMLRVPLADLELLVLAILIQKEVGGNLAEIIDTIASTIRERITIQREIKALTAQGKLSGIVVGLLPVFLGIMMAVINLEYVIVLFTHPLGRMMVASGLISMAFGVFIISRIVNIEV